MLFSFSGFYKIHLVGYVVSAFAYMKVVEKYVPEHGAYEGIMGNCSGFGWFKRVRNDERIEHLKEKGTVGFR